MNCDYAYGKCLGCGKPVSSIWDFQYCNCKCMPSEIVYEAMRELDEHKRHKAKPFSTMAFPNIVVREIEAQREQMSAIIARSLGIAHSLLNNKEHCSGQSIYAKFRGKLW